MLLNQTRKLAGIAVLIAGGMFLTACDPASEGSGADTVKSGQGASSSAPEAVSSPDASPGSGSGSKQSDNRADGTVTGVLGYMAPGKLTVDGRPFWIAEDTEIWGAGDICGDAAGQSASKCTVEQLEKAAKTGKTKAEVQIAKGRAVKVIDQNKTGGGPAAGQNGGGGAKSGNRADGTVTGVLGYMAPGKLTVDGRPFWIAEDTEIWGAGDICGDAAGQSASKCTVEQLEKAAKTGKTKAEVQIAKGFATEIREQ